MLFALCHSSIEMVLKSLTPFPFFAPPPPSQRPPTEIRLARWNNANAENFIRHERTQKELEDQLRLQKRFDSALSIVHNYNPAPPHQTTFKSTGTPSAPSSPSIPGKSSKYSRSPKPHPAFESLVKPRKIRIKDEETPRVSGQPIFRIDEKGVSYEIPEAPFLYQYSYTETPKAKPVKLREPLVSPFGPESMAKPWMGRKPLSKKKLPEFDSFQLPPPNKKGVKPIQAPGPFIMGSGPKYVRSREEIIGEPLTKEEIDVLIQGAKKSERQLNIGRDGLTHNMLDNIHAHWKRRRVCKIKCKGVCTVDMNNVCQQLEEKSGGKIIYNRGGVVYLFRGRNYNYKSRPRFPLMLWKPVSPVYPRLIQRVPEGLTVEEASSMRERGRDLPPICKLAKNGVYCDLARYVKEAFEACELVRINCQGLNATDYRKIGAKLKDHVPCVLISFEREHILIWRGRDWKSSLTEPKENPKLKAVKLDDITVDQQALESSASSVSSLSDVEEIPSPTLRNGEYQGGNHQPGVVDEACEVSSAVFESVSTGKKTEELEKSVVCKNFSNHLPEAFDQSVEIAENAGCSENMEFKVAVPQSLSQLDVTKADNQSILTVPWTAGVLFLQEKAVKNGMAMVLDDHNLDPDIVFEKTVAFTKDAPTGPIFRRKPRKDFDNEQEQECDKSEIKETPGVLHKEIRVSDGKVERKNYGNENMKDIKADYLNVVPQGNLRVDELAKLLS